MDLLDQIIGLGLFLGSLALLWISGFAYANGRKPASIIYAIFAGGILFCQTLSLIVFMKPLLQ